MSEISSSESDLMIGSCCELLSVCLTPVKSYNRHLVAECVCCLETVVLRYMSKTKNNRKVRTKNTMVLFRQLENIPT